VQACRFLPLGPDHEPLWVRLYVHQISEKWAALLLVEEEPPSAPRAAKGQAFFGETPEEAEQAAKAYLGCTEPGN